MHVATEQIAERPTELGLAAFVAIALSFGWPKGHQKNRAQNDPFLEDRTRRPVVVLGTRSPGSTVCGPLLND